MKHTTHNILTLIAASIMTFASVPAMASENYVMEEPSMEIAEDLQNAVTIEAKGSTLNITNAEGLVLEVYNITGVKVYTTKIDSQSKKIELNQLTSGCYIVKIGKVARKVYIK